MSVDQNYRSTIIYDVRGIDQSIRKTQRVLYFANALRLSIVDIQQLSRDPNIGQMLWTAVQLTRVWTHLHRIITATNKAQRIGIAQGVLGGGLRGARMARTLAAGQSTLAFGAGGKLGINVSTSAFAAMSAFALANPAVAILLGTGLAIGTFGFRKYFLERKMLLERRDFIERQREIAKAQGYES